MDHIILIATGVALAAFAVGYFVRKLLAEAKIASAESEAKKILDEAEGIISEEKSSNGNDLRDSLYFTQLAGGDDHSFRSGDGP
jgi:hypothetical protein